MKRYFIIGGVLLAAAAFAWPLLGSGQRAIGTVESTHGIPFPADADGIHIFEKLAHVDIYLHEPVLAKELQLTIQFDPGNTTDIAVGVRMDDFWLSYPKQFIWDGAGERKLQTATVTIPLTAAFQETDQSLDVMFFANTEESSAAVEEGVNDTVNWRLVSLQAQVRPTIPTLVDLKDYVRSILKRERAQ